MSLNGTACIVGAFEHPTRKADSQSVLVPLDGELFRVTLDGTSQKLGGGGGDLLNPKLSPKGYEEISRAHLLEPTNKASARNVVWSHPAFAYRHVFARSIAHEHSGCWPRRGTCQVPPPNRELATPAP